jgi:hypothetical protein
METIKKWEYFSFSLALGIIAVGFFFKSITIAFLVFGFGLLVQGCKYPVFRTTYKLEFKDGY